MIISKEVKIGVLATIALIIFFVGLKFLSGADIFSKDREYFCIYQNVEGLQNSAVIQINGLNVGHVASLQLVPGKGVKVLLDINKGLELPEGTIAKLGSYDIMGTKMIMLIPGPGPGSLKAGDELKAAREGGMLDNVSSELTPRLRELKSTISTIDNTLNGVNDLMNAENKREIAEALHAVNLTANNLAQLTSDLKKQTSEINSMIHNANSVTANLAKNNDTINHILTNVNGITTHLNNAHIEKMVEDIRSTLTEYKNIAEKINDSKGTAGLLVNNKDLYINMNHAVKMLDSLETDMRARPSRYISLSFFGRKKS